MPAVLPVFYTSREGVGFTHFYSWTKRPLSLEHFEHLRDSVAVTLCDKEVHALFFRGLHDSVVIWDCVNGVRARPYDYGVTMAELIRAVERATYEAEIGTVI